MVVVNAGAGLLVVWVGLFTNRIDQVGAFRETPTAASSRRNDLAYSCDGVVYFPCGGGFYFGATVGGSHCFAMDDPPLLQ